MSAFVILAAGKGSRMGRVGSSLHKALVPLGPHAVISHLFDLAPTDARIIVCVGHRHKQIKEYVKLAHPSRDVTFRYVDGWDEVGNGPGASLLAAKDDVGYDDMIFTSVDTLWSPDPSLWVDNTWSWSAVSTVPAGTMPTRWCRMSVSHDGDNAFAQAGYVIDIYDKRQGAEDAPAYVGLSRIMADDLPVFWGGITRGSLVNGERQVSAGLEELVKIETLGVRHVHWTDVGDETAYRRAVADYVGYDWTKTNEATYVLPREGRVVKFFDDPDVVVQRQARARELGAAVPELIDNGEQMLAYRYVDGRTLYDVMTHGPEDATHAVHGLLEWATQHLWRDTDVENFSERCMRFYRDKTFSRVDMLPRDLRGMCLDILARLDWEGLCTCGQPSTWHGDFNFGNVIYTATGNLFVGIDWRQDFAGDTIGDRRYDYAKLLAGCVVHWGNARRGNFSRWELRDDLQRIILEYAVDHGQTARDLQIIGALSLLNSAPLHAAPLDEVLVARGLAWLEEVL